MKIKIDLLILNKLGFVFQAAIANAKTLEEVERLNNMLKTGQIPGRAALNRLGTVSVTKTCRYAFVNCL